MDTLACTNLPEREDADRTEKKMYGIGPYRRTGRMLGWRVSINRRGDWVNGTFRADKYGGMDQALRAATAFRDEVNQNFTPMHKQVYCAILRSNNTSGVPGVFRTQSGEWKARIQFPDGRCKTRQFAIHLYGDEEACRRAVEARAALLLEVSGNTLHHDDVRDRDTLSIASLPELAVTPHKDVPAHNPYPHVFVDKRGDVGRVHVKTQLASGEVAVTAYRVAEIKKPNGLPKRRYFSVALYGEEEAERLAWAQRRAWETDPASQVAPVRSIR